MNTMSNIQVSTADGVSPAESLTPCQAEALHKIELLLRVSPVLGFMGPAGSGRSTVLRALRNRLGGRMITAEDMARVTNHQLAESFEDVIGAEIMSAIAEHDMVILDDLAYFTQPGSNASNRPGFVRTVMRRLVMTALAKGCKLVLCGRPPEAWSTAADQFGPQAAAVTLGGFRIEDYAQIGRTLLGAACPEDFDFATLYRYSSHLNGYQLKLAFSLLALQTEPGHTPTAEEAISVLEAHVLSSNTRVSEVEHITFQNLPGHEEIIEALETNIILPMENRALAQRLGLKPKRGVLLYGPPGTGKTSIGRALAHRMRGKFFLIDGSFISEPPAAFFGKFESVVAEAKDCAPAVLFIDDADVLFRVEHIAGLSRYLLSLLDGLESETASQVCVMMTAMNVALIPEALLRSGRVELWLETKAPDEATRARIIERWVGAEIGAGSGDLDFAALAAITEGFTPADLRRLVGDAKMLFAADVVHNRPARGAAEYFQRATDQIVTVRNRMAEGMKDPSLRLTGGKYPVNAMAGVCGW